MTTPINLNKARKAKAKIAKTKQADENAVKFGRSKASREAEKSVEAKRVTSLEAHKRET